MKRSLLSLVSMLLFCGGLNACASHGDRATDSDQVAASSDEIVTGAIGPIFWPMGPITWNGTVGTWPIAVYSPVGINTLVFDIPGATSLSLSLAGVDGVPFAGYTPLVITDPWMTTFTGCSWLGGLMPYYGMM